MFAGSACTPVFDAGQAPEPAPLMSVTAGGVSAAQIFKQVEHLPAVERVPPLREYYSDAPDPLSKQKAAYVLARALQSRGGNPELSEAIDLFEVASQYKPLWERCQWHISECATGLSEEKTARVALESIVSRSTDETSKASAQYALAQSFLRTSEKDKAQADLLKLRKTAPNSQYAIGSLYYLGEMALASGKQEDAIALFRQYLAASSDGRFAIEILNRLKTMPGFTPTIDDRNLFARVYFANGDYSGALREWQTAKNNREWFKQAIALVRSKRFKEAQTVLVQGITANPDDEAVVPAATLLAKYLNKAETIQLWRTVLGACPKHKDAALYNLAYRTDNLNYYNEILRTHPTSAFAPESAWWLTWNAIRSGNSERALVMAQAGLRQYGETKAGPRFAFWIGKLQERLGRRELARTVYQAAADKYGWHYYGHRARAKLAALSGKRDRGWDTHPARDMQLYAAALDENQDWTWPEPPELVSFEQIQRSAGPTIAALTELRQWEEAFQLLPKDALPLLRSFYYAKLNQPLQSINEVSGKIRGHPHGTPSWKMAYPLLYARGVNREATAKHVDPLLAQALIREESRYNVQALSSSHAIGLMQLLPGTAHGVAKRIGVKLSSNADIHKPENNIRLGVDYMSYVLNRANGNALLAVASYNGGPNAVARWQQSLGTADMDLFVEQIPYTETRDYVRKVFGSYWNYEMIYSTK
jgi:soluble lytic murein transglycosylase